MTIQPPTAESELQEQQASAYHEAGHAVVALNLGAAVRKLTIVPRGDETGSTDYEIPNGAPEDGCCILLAGFEAEKKWNPGAPLHAGTVDKAQALECLRVFPPGQRAAVLEQQRQRAADLVSRLWGTITDLAAELLKLKTMGPGELYAFLIK